MTANAFNRQSLLYEAEGAWGEAIDTWGERLQIQGAIDTSTLIRNMIRMQPTIQRLGEGQAHRRGVYDPTSEFTFSVEAGGHGAAPTGALTETPLNTLLGYALGNSDASSVGTVADGVGTASAFDVDAGTFAASSLCRVGTNDPRDARGNGQVGAVNNLAAGTLTLFNALDATPNDSDVVYPMMLAYPEVITSAITGLRFNFQTANYRWKLRGCWVKDLQLTALNPGELPMWTFTVGVSWFDAEVGSTWPSTTATDQKCGAPVSGGSLHVQDVGTVTRQLFEFRQLAIQLVLGSQPLLGPGGADYQIVTGAVRTSFECYIDFTVDAEDATATPFWLSWWDTPACDLVFQEVVGTINAGAGRCIGFHAPRTKPAHDWPAPTQMDLDALNRVHVRLEVETNTVLTNDLTLAPIVFGAG